MHAITTPADEWAGMSKLALAIMEWIKKRLIPPREQLKDSRPRAAMLAELSGQLLLPGIADPHRWDFSSGK